jgi:hypothetical protein
MRFTPFKKNNISLGSSLKHKGVLNKGDLVIGLDLDNPSFYKRDKDKRKEDQSHTGFFKKL